ncbi:MAG: hypothetical protein RMM08_05355 [Armatimonadota bacterium]|nr:hypothetical protein [bacterium]MDW8320768.1 hypothetical protein [Armatimonadota bacterium]
MNIAFCVLTALWLVMQVLVPVYHHHGGGNSPSSASVQWQNAHGDEHECYVCHLNYSPANVTPSNGELVPVLESAPLTAVIQSLHLPDPVVTPSVRAPPIA